jgi:molybdopterin-synthase adenylyltransferase
VHGYQADDFAEVELSVALPREVDRQLIQHFTKDFDQEDLTFAYWRPSPGAERYSAIIYSLNLPSDTERRLQGNVAFTAAYLARVLDECPEGSGIALLHSHLGPGWQTMSHDDIVAERDRLAGVVSGQTDLPLLGLTWGTDETWSARFWLRTGRNSYQRHWAATVRSVGQRLRLSYNPSLRPPSPTTSAQVATVSVWGEKQQQDLVRTRVGIIGLGSVGSIVAEALSRTGLQQITLIDHDYIEERNLDRTLGALRSDVAAKTPKVEVAKRLIRQSYTADNVEVTSIAKSLLTPEGLQAAMDCDVLICCVDRPLARHILNVLAYAHLIPVIDGGIIAHVNESGSLQHVSWRIHTVGPERACLYCLDALSRSDVGLDQQGLLDSPDYVKGLSKADRERYARRNVFGFSLSVASHEILQLVGLITGNQRIGGAGTQTYHAYPGIMEVSEVNHCKDDCDMAPLLAQAVDLVTSTTDS